MVDGRCTGLLEIVTGRPLDGLDLESDLGRAGWQYVCEAYNYKGGCSAQWGGYGCRILK